MERYQIILEGETPLLMHRDNIQFSERVRAWQQENRSLSVAGDDRTPAWSWIGSLYDDGEYVGLNADNVMTMLREAGYELGNCDCTICAEAPKLNPHISAMTRCLAEVMGVSESQISIKATTTEKLGFVGKKEGIAAHAVVLIN